MDKLRLYHAGPKEIPEPDIHYGRKNADFGQGFYLSPDLDFVQRWAANGSVINVYELQLEGLSVHRFAQDAQWFDYLFHNRRLQDRLTADVIIGPIANDTIFDTLGILSSGYLEPADALQLLSIGPLYTQVTLKTQRAASQLTFLSSTPVTDHDPTLQDAEQQAYLDQFAPAMTKI